MLWNDGFCLRECQHTHALDSITFVIGCGLGKQFDIDSQEVDMLLDNKRSRRSFNKPNTQTPKILFSWNTSNFVRNFIKDVKIFLVAFRFFSLFLFISIHFVCVCVDYIALEWSKHNWKEQINSFVALKHFSKNYGDKCVAAFFSLQHSLPSEIRFGGTNRKPCN